MSSATPPTPPSKPVPPVSSVPPPPTTREEITIYSHSNLFYWWPIWALGFLFGVLTFFSHHVMAIVPNEIEVSRTWLVQSAPGEDPKPREGILVVNDGKHHLPPATKINNALEPPEKPHLKVSGQKDFGMVFVLVLLFVIATTNVPLRGLWSVVAILVVLMLLLMAERSGMLGQIVDLYRLIDIRINMAGYMLLATGLIIPWLQAFFFWDHQIYIRFTPGQMRVVTAVGSGEQVYDTQGMTVEKQRSDFFRNVVIAGPFGGSGDLIVRTSGAQAHQFELHNVLGISRKVSQIEEMLRKRNVIETKN
jgi:hypothetical protein